MILTVVAVVSVDGFVLKMHLLTHILMLFMYFARLEATKKIGEFQWGNKKQPIKKKEQSISKSTKL